MPISEFVILFSLSVSVLVIIAALVLLRKKVVFVTASNAKFKSIFESIWKIEKAVLETVVFEVATEKVVNIILSELGYVNYGYEVIVLSLLDEKRGGLRRIAISKTEAAGKFLTASPIPFEEIFIPFSASDNLSVKAINEKKMFVTKNVSDVLYPAIDREWVENFQITLGIKTSIVYPIVAKDKMLGTLIFSLSKEQGKISDEEWSILDSFVGAAGIALDNALLFQRLTDTTAQLRVANERLKGLDKLKDEFVSLASHELRTPMTIIKSYIWLILNGKVGEVSEKQGDYLKTVYASTERLINLVNDMLNISRIESGRLTIEKKPLDIVNLIQDLVSQMQSRGDELGIKIEYNKPNAPVNVNADAERISQVIINLIGNSLKFTPRGGEINVVVAQDTNGFVQISVTDNGRGMSANDIGKLFQKFSMIGDTHLTKEKGQGTGLGLYLSKSLIEMHGGKIWAESEGEGKGSIFKFTLPLIDVNSQPVNVTKDAISPVSAPAVLSPEPPLNKDLPHEPNPPA